MHRITAMVALLLLVSGIAFADEKKTATKSSAKEEVLKMSAEDVFNFVEAVVKNPKADRAAAKKFLDAAMRGEVRMLQVGTQLTGDTKCFGGIRQCADSCATCNSTITKCRCTTCCIALQP